MANSLSNRASTEGYQNPTLTSDIKKFYLSDDLTDVHFVFPEEQQSERVPAHKMLLAVKSDVFRAMFFGEMKEMDDITIVDASRAAFMEFLQFFYLDKVKLTLENISEVVNLCKKYNISGGLSICEQFLKDSINNENVCTAYGLAMVFDLDDLKQQCETIIKANTEAVFKSPNFVKCDRALLGQILLYDSLSCSEVKVFEACMKWVKEASKEDVLTKELVHAHLGLSFNDIRFTSMTIQQLADLTPMYGHLFTVDEYQDIVQAIASKSFQPKMFKKEPRKMFMIPATPAATSTFGRNATLFGQGFGTSPSGFNFGSR